MTSTDFLCTYTRWWHMEDLVIGSPILAGKHEKAE